MRKKLLSIFALAVVAVSLHALDGVSTSTARFLNAGKQGLTTPQLGNKSPKIVKAQKINGTEMVQCFIYLNDGNTNEIVANGGIVNAHFGKDLVVATVPVDKIATIAKARGIKQIATAKMLEMKTDTARSVTGAEKVWNGADNGLPQGYDGTGVVLGIIDDGIEYNHLAFKDANGVSRVKRVYDPRTSASGGSTVTINGETLTGKQYTTAAQISALTTDDSGESHGTHTTGCAAGSLVGKYSGMAPGVDIVLCGCGEDLSDTNIAQSALYIAEYAKSVGKPCVISISLGSSQGPHDGTSAVCQVYDQIANEYNAVILLAAGNEADMNGSLRKTITTSSSTTPGIATIWDATSDFKSYYGSSYTLYGGLDIWNDSSNPLEIQFVVLNSSGTVQYTSDKIAATSADGQDISGMSSYFGSSYELKVYSGVDETNNRYNIYVDAQLGKSGSSGGWWGGGSSTTYYLGVLVYGANGDQVAMYTDMYYSVLSSRSSSSYTFTAGDGACSICDDVTGKKTISIGAWYSRNRYPTNNGSSSSTISNSGGSVGTIAYFSSYGTDFNGVNHPFISSPGHCVVSSVNRYDSSNSASGSAQYQTISGSTRDYWAQMSGTSMATPVAAGVVALLKQVAPDYTVDQIKEALAASAIHDSYMPSPNVRYGEGKINALGAVEYILAQQEDPDDYTLGDVNNDKAINVFDVVSTALYINGNQKGVFNFNAGDVNVDGTINIVDLVGIVNLSLGLDVASSAPLYAMGQQASPGADECLSVAPISLKAGESRDVVVALNNHSNYTALQLDLQLPQGVTASDLRVSSRAANHTATLTRLQNGDNRILAYSTSNEQISGNEGTLLTFTITADNDYIGSGELVLDNITLVDRTLRAATVQPLSISLAAKEVTAIDKISSQLTIYSAGNKIIVDSPVAQPMIIATSTGAYTRVPLRAGHNEFSLPGQGVYIVRVADKVLKVRSTH